MIQNILLKITVDAVRLFILSDSPPEKDVQWSDQGMASSYKFIQKLWILHTEVKNKILYQKESKKDENLDSFVNEMISKITGNLEKFNYNVIIANMYETYNFFIKYIKDNKNIINLKENYKKILICFSPVVPHFASECLSEIKEDQNLIWPKFDLKLLEKEEINFVIQINGKKRTVLKVRKNIIKSEVLEIIKKDNIINKHLDGREINKVIFVQNRLMNILLNE